MVDFDRISRRSPRAPAAALSGVRGLFRRHVTDRATAAEALTEDQSWRRHQIRRLVVLVTLPGVLLGTASIAAAYGSGLMSHEAPTCDPTVVPAPARPSFDITVMNASGINGAATTVGRELTRRGFTVVDASTAPRELYVNKPASIYHGEKGLDQALLAAQQISGAELYGDGRSGTSISFVLGAGFAELLPAPPPKPPKAGEVKVNVYNTTWRSGLADEVASELAERGFKTGKVGNDPDRKFLPKDVAVIRYGPDADLAAKVVAEQVPGATLEQVERTSKRVDIVLGNRYESLTPVADLPKPPVEPPAPPPSVSRPCTPGE